MKKVISIILAAIIVSSFALMAMGSNSNSSTSDSPQKVGEAGNSTTTTSAPVKVSYVPGDIVEAGNLRVTYVSCGTYVSTNQFIQPESGNRFVEFKFEFENIGNSDTYISSFEFECYADGYSCEQHYVIDNDLSATLSAGRKTSGSVVFEVPSSATSIEVEYETNFWTENKIVFAYN